ncbi:MAG: LapA family protein [Deltaproteobacteria bacterium]|nr:LapA family protein [Deltaproteobacteria bacterium]
MRFFKVIFATLFVMFGITFIIQNLEILTRTVQLKLDLYFTTFQTPNVHLWGLILFTFFLGVFTASLYGIYEIIKQKQTIRQLQHNLEILGQELKRASGPVGGTSSEEP